MSLSHLNLNTNARKPSVSHRRSGHLDASELALSLEKCGFAVTPKQARLLVQQADPDDSRGGEGSVTFDQFVALAESEEAMYPNNKEPVKNVCSFMPAGVRKQYARLSWRASWIVAHPHFDVFIILLVVLVGIGCFCQLAEANGPGISSFYAITEYLSLTVFTAEIVLKFIACGEKPLELVRDPEDGAFNLLDLIIVIFSLALKFSGQDGSMLMIGRLMRLIKILLKVPQLKYVLLGFAAGISSVSSISELV